MMIPVAIYKVTNILNGKMYIGQSIHPKRRFTEHKNGSKSKILSAAIQKYGEENFKFDILCWCPDKSYADMVEMKLIEAHDTRMVGYNICIGGEGLGSGKDHPKFGMKATDETRRRIAESKMGELNPMFGKENTPEQKAKISESLLGREITWGDKISEAKKGIRTSDHHLVPIVCKKEDDLRYYSTIQEAADALGVSRGSIWRWVEEKACNSTGWIIQRAADGPDPFINIRNAEYKAPRKGQAKKVICERNGQRLEFASRVETAEALGVDVASIARWLKGSFTSRAGWAVTEPRDGD